MKQTLNLISSFMMIAFFGIATISFTSCGDDDINGCTNPDSDNYNVEATVDDGSCIAARDKFIGSYLGSLTCPGALATTNNDSLAFTISEGLDGDNVINVQLTDSVLAFPIPGTVSGNNVTFDIRDLGPFPFDTPLGTLQSTITMTGTGVYDSSTNNMTADLQVTLKSADSGATIAQDDCVIEGTKQ